MPDMLNFMLDIGVAVQIGFVVRALVQYLKPAWSKVDERLAGPINLLTACVIGIALSFAWLAVHDSGQGVGYGIGLGIWAAAVSVVYNDLRSSLEERQGSDGIGVLQIASKVTGRNRNKNGS